MAQFVKRSTPYIARAEFEARDPLPEGWYAARISHAERRERNGKACVSMSFRISSGPHAGRTVFEDFWLTDAARGRSMQMLRNMVDDVGYSYDGSDDDLTWDISSLVDAALDMRVRVEPARGDYRARNRVADTSAAGTRVPPANTPTPPTIRTAAPISAPAAAMTPIADNDIPF